MSVVPNQVYPDAPSWETIKGIFLNGWVGEGTRYLRVLQDKNSLALSARMIIGAQSRIAGYMPSSLRPAINQNLLGFIQGGPQVVLEVWTNGALALSSASISMTEPEMLAAYAGKDVYVQGVYPRGVPVS